MNQSNPPRILPRFIVLGLLLALVVLIAGLARAGLVRAAGQSEANDIWHDVAETAIVLEGERLIVPQRYRTIAADLSLLKEALAAAPMEFTEAARVAPAVVSLPLPGGGFGAFNVVESPIMEPELAAQFPEIKTYVVAGLDDPYASGRIDLTPKGFHAMIFTLEGTFFIDPYSRNDTTHYISYYRADYRNDSPFVKHEPIGDPEEIAALVEEMEAKGGIQTGDELRTYRLALATTGEYSQYHGGTVPLVMAELVVAVNRVTGLYERDTAVRLVLIANNTDIIYLNPATDPYTNNSGGAMLGENQANLDAVIGNANYDIGHVFSTGGGGIAGLGVVCRTGNKARGVTGLPNPIGDPFYVDYVAHEMGHQYGGNHTFNGSEGACSGGNRSGAHAYEPGSGTTIMAYAGICGSQNIQNNSDDHFHGESFNEIVAYTTTGFGNTCPVITNTGNNPPTATVPASNFAIPLDTPFALTGSGSDPDGGDVLTYMWEEFDLGPPGHPNSPSLNAPIFRSFPAKSTPTRVFPQWSDIVNNTQTIGEILPTYERDMTFRLTVRDNNVSPSAGGVAFATVAFTVTDQAGPFLVTGPNTGSENWAIGAMETVNWDVANTDVGPVNCSGVNIDLSTDGGYTYPTNLASGVPNDGAHPVVVPNLPTATARVRVECANNIFFDISNADFTISNQGPFSELDVGKWASHPTLSSGDIFTYTIVVTNSGNIAANMTVTDTFPAGFINPVCNGVPGDLSDTVSLPAATDTAYECIGQVDPALAVELGKEVDNASVNAGTAVTYTITITNPTAAYTLTNVIVSDPDVAGCTPALGTPITLPPLASQVYVCPDNVLTGDTTNTATVTADFTLSNVATASAPGAINSPANSPVVVRTVELSDSDSVFVDVSGWSTFMPVITGDGGAAAVPVAAGISLAGLPFAIFGIGFVLSRRKR